MTAKYVNITILEPSQIIHEGLSNIFLKSGQYYKLFRADNLEEIESLSQKQNLDIVIINPSLIQNKEREFAALKRNKPDICWVAIIYTFFDQQVFSLFDNIIHITDTPEKIVSLIEKLNNKNHGHSSGISHEQLSEREIEVLKLLAAGLSNKEIADKLFISIHTVISHRKNITQKTGIKSQAGLTIYAISNKIILIEDF